MAYTLSQAASSAVRTLQGWYGADSYAASTGLYHWDDPTFSADAGGSVAAGLINAYGYHDAFQDTLRWWNCANAITALIDYMLITNTDIYIGAVEQTFAQAQTAFTINQGAVEVGAGAAAAAGAVGGAAVGAEIGGLVGAVIGGIVGGLAGLFGGGGVAAATFARISLTNFINPSGFYDDEGWWALAWLKAYDLTNDDRYLNMAVTIFDDMTNGWDFDACPGGIYWAKNHADSNGNTPYKNAIANELFLAVGAGLYRRLMKRGAHWVYFMGTANTFQGSDTKLWLILDDGSRQSQIGGNTTTSSPFVTPDGWVYFQGTDNKLWKVFNDGSQQSQIGPNTTEATPFVTSAGPAAFSNFLDWAEREWIWFDSRGGMINSSNLVNDGLTTSASPAGPCKNDNTEAIWTYNQGVILGALCDLAEITGKDCFLKRAEEIANALIANPADPSLSPPASGVDENHILTEFTDITSSGAGEGINYCQFKGVFVRNLATLCTKTHNARYAAFIRRNAATAIAHMYNGTQFGHRWDAELDIADFVRQTAGVDLLNAALAVGSVGSDLSYLDPLLLGARDGHDLSYLEPLLLD